MTRATRPSRSQYKVARAVTGWYLNTYYGTPEDVGIAAMFCRQDRVGYFAVDAEALAEGDGDALFRLLITMTMFQRRSDHQIMRVLKGIAQPDAIEMTDSDALLRLADSIECPYSNELNSLKKYCDLAKDPVSKKGWCSIRPDTACHMKRHTELLKRYGHFGKVPTSAALALRAHSASSLADLKNGIWNEIEDPNARARALEKALSRSWRVSDKIAAMFLSAVTNRALSGELAPWISGIDTNHFVVIDSNVDLFLKSIGYTGPSTYRARREFVQMLAARISLHEYRKELEPYNPRLVQQAFYMFMSISNRRANANDCRNAIPPICPSCPQVLTRVCTSHCDSAFAIA